MQIYWTKIKQIIDETDEIKTFILETPEDLIWEEGSYIHLALKGFNEGENPDRDLIRHMSITTLPNENKIGITTRIKEQCSRFKATLREHQVGDEVAIFKIRCNVPLRRENKNIYLLSAGVGLATFRPLALSYFEHPNNIASIHLINIDTSGQFLYQDIFKSSPVHNFSAQFIDNRKQYYEHVTKIASDKEGIFYIVGSDEFIKDNIALLLDQEIKRQQIMLDKREDQLVAFFPEEIKI